MTPQQLDILIIDDNPVDREIIKRLCTQANQKSGHELQMNFLEAENGVDGYRIFFNQRPDFLLIDYQLPDLDGLEFLTKLSERFDLNCLAAIMMTGQGNEQVAVQAMKLGVQDYLVKGQTSADAMLRAISNALQKSSMQTKLKEAERRRKQDLERAMLTQQAILPHSAPIIPNLTIGYRYQPIEEISGDFYEFLQFGGDEVGIVVGDISGHGLPAAFLSFMVLGSFNICAMNHIHPRTTLYQVFERLEGKWPDGSLASLFYLVYNHKTRQLNYTSAGHPPSFVIRSQSNEIQMIETKGSILGIPLQLAEFEELTIQLEKGDKVLMYTDGIVEVFGKNEEILGVNRLREFLHHQHLLPIQQLIDSIYDWALEFSPQQEFSDDITLVGLEVT